MVFSVFMGARFKKLCAVFIVCCYSFEICAAGATRGSFWQDRRGLRQEKKLQLAQLNLPLAVPVSALTSDSIPISLQQNLSNYPEIPAEISQTILPYAEVVSLHLSSPHRSPAAARNFFNAQEKMVVLIEDAHQVESAQRNIAFLSAGLIESGISFVSLEGAWGTLAPLEQWRAQKDSISRQKTAGYFARLGWLTGAETAILSSGKNNIIVRGAENESQYH